MTAIEFGWAGRALDAVSGDEHVFAPFPGGALIVLLDGLGHGPEAADASLAAVRLLEQNPAEPVVDLVRRCHEGTRRTRGAVMSLASFSFDHSTMTWLGIGNVAGVLLRGDASSKESDRALLTRAGTVGYQLPPMRPETLPVFPGDMLIFTTDGIRDSFNLGLPREAAPQEIAESILARFTRGNDDAHVTVARYVGGSA
jgi:negative regulator of sigma-B (phosphoserine phosphatase)